MERSDRVGHLERRGPGGRDIAAHAKPRLCGTLEAAGLRCQLENGLQSGRCEHPRPRIGEGQRARMELGQEPQCVHLERRGLDDPFEAVGRHIVAALDRHPVVRVAVGQTQDRADDLAEHRPEVRARILRVVDLGPEPRLADREARGDGGGRHPDVDAEATDLRRPVVKLEVMPDQVAGDPEVAADRLADAVAVERPGERIGDGVGDRAVVLVAGIQRGDEVVATLQDGAGQQLDPLRDDGAQVRIDDHERLHLECVRDLEDGSQGRTLATDPIDLRVGQADPLEPVGGADEQDLLDIVGRLGLDDDATGPVGRSRVRIDHDRMQVREVLHEAGLRRAHDVTDRRRVLEARDADHDVGPAEPLDLIADGRRQGCLGHGFTVPPSAARHPADHPVRVRHAGQVAAVGRLERDAGKALGPP